ncbi:regulatory signaling modulator protein AmpE [Escherichia coli]
MPVRLAGVVYALIGHGEKALPPGLLRWVISILRSIRC